MTTLVTAIPAPLSVDELQLRIRQKRVAPPDEKELLRSQVAALTARNAEQEDTIRGLQDRLLIIKAACS